MRFLAMPAVILLAGCASLDSDLKSADSKCTPGSAMTAFVTCLNGMEEPVWQKDAPDHVADYRRFAAARMSLALDLDSGKISATQFRDGAAAARATFSAHLRTGQQQAASQRAEDDMQQMLQHSPPPGADGMGMGMGMNNMGM